MFECLHKRSIQTEHDTSLIEPRHDKTNKMAVRTAKIQVSLGIRADAQADLSLRWAQTHFSGFVMSRLKFSSIVVTCKSVLTFASKTKIREVWIFPPFCSDKT